MWSSLGSAVHETDVVSFFVDQKCFSNLSPLDILRHNAYHLSNVLAKLTLVQHANDRIELIAQEVIPDLFIYGLQFSNAYGCDPAELYGRSVGRSVAEVRSLSELRTLQMQLDDELFRAGSESGIMQRVASERFELAPLIMTLIRIADKADHGVELPQKEFAEEAVPRFMISSMRLSAVYEVDMDQAVSVRLRQIRDKYGDVRLLLNQEVPT